MGCCCQQQEVQDSPELVKNCSFISESIMNANLWGNDGALQNEMRESQNGPWLISPEPFWISQDTLDFFEILGDRLLAFYRAANKLYFESVRGREPDWVHEYLELGKPELVIDYGRMSRFRNDLPLIIRPDIFLTEDGAIATELDSVPGGFGILDALSRCYEKLGFRLPGGGDGITREFAQAMRGLVPQIESPVLVIVVSRESSSYWNEMVWFAKSLRDAGFEAFAARPEEIGFTEEGLFLGHGSSNQVKIDIIYRFFELFDLKNIPKIDLLLYAVRKQKVVITPPIKSYLEEKLLFALLHHLALAGFWRKELGEETYSMLKGLFPETWILDPRPVPPHAVIPGLEVGGLPVTDFRQLGRCTQRERELVIKPSGFSELAWGSHGVKVGHDLSSKEWNESLEIALGHFYKTPHVLQRFHKARKVAAQFYDLKNDQVTTMAGRARLCPYYFVSGDKARLGGVLATICPPDKKLIHGMIDAIMAPAAAKRPKPCRIARSQN